MRLCRCPRPARDTVDPTRVLWCTTCKGHSADGRPPTVAQVRAEALEVVKLANAVIAAYALLEGGLWEATTAGRPPQEGDGGRRKRDGDDRVLSLAVNGDLQDKRRWAAIMWARLQAARNNLGLADACAGEIALIDDRHQPPAPPPSGRWWEVPVTADTPADQVPSHLEEAHAALTRRRAQGRP